MSLKLPPRKSSALSLKHEINVTPFIDVMLVLLIIFMVAAPLATRQMPVDLPTLSAGAQTPEQPITLWITEDDLWYVNDALVDRNQVISHLSSIQAQGVSSARGAESQAKTNPRLQIRADKTLTYERIMAAMNMLSAAGYTQIGLIGIDGGTGSRTQSQTAEQTDLVDQAPAPAASDEAGLSGVAG